MCNLVAVLARVSVASLLAAALLAGCGDGGAAGADPAKRPLSRTLVVAGYTTPREVYAELLTLFAAARAEKGETIKIEQSWQGSGGQARNVVGGFEADVVALSLEPDVAVIEKPGLIKPDWKAKAVGGMVSRSIVVLGVRPGNPKNIAGWEDLARDDVSVLTPNVRMSGGARWNVAAIWGAALRGKTSVAANDPAAAEALLRKILSRVTIMDKGARESMLTFESGVGDVVVTYENEVFESKRAGKAVEVVIPSSTLLIENPVAVVDAYVEKHATRDLADAFVEMLVADPAQKIFAAHGYRPVSATVPLDPAVFPPVADLFTVKDLGGWQKLDVDLFTAQGAYDRALQGAAASPALPAAAK